MAPTQSNLVSSVRGLGTSAFVPTVDVGENATHGSEAATQPWRSPCDQRTGGKSATVYPLFQQALAAVAEVEGHGPS